MNLTINGQSRAYDGDPSMPLLWYLRDELSLTGTKFGCGISACGACTVHLDGKAIRSCVTPMQALEGKSVTTIEGVASPEKLHPLQQAFLENAALQCGICTPGFILAAKALLERNPKPTEHEVRAWLAGNLCRCTGYDKIVRAVLEAAGSPPSS